MEDLESRLVWILGSPRSGSSWLYRLLTADPDVAGINEPYVGHHLVPLEHAVPGEEFFSAGDRSQNPNYLFAERYRERFTPLLRRLVLDGIAGQLSELQADPMVPRIVLKEPNGSHAADSIIQLLPRSRLIFLARDGRDVVDSITTAMLREASWWHSGRRLAVTGPQLPRRELIQREAERWALRTAATRRAMALLEPESRVLVRYEDLLADTRTVLTQLALWLGSRADSEWVGAVTEAFEFEAVPGELRGPDMAIRAGTPGLWRRNFDEDERRLLNEIMGEQLAALGYD